MDKQILFVLASDANREIPVVHDAMVDIGFPYLGSHVPKDWQHLTDDSQFQVRELLVLNESAVRAR